MIFFRTFGTIPQDNENSYSIDATQNSTNKIESESSDILNILVYTTNGKKCNIKILKSLKGAELKFDSMQNLTFDEVKGSNNISSEDLNRSYLVNVKTKQKIDETITLSDLNITSNGKKEKSIFILFAYILE